MSFKNYKKDLHRVEDIPFEMPRWRTRSKFDFRWDRRGSWKLSKPRRHPGWSAYHANKQMEEC
jgi:hypothetical protein